MTVTTNLLGANSAELIITGPEDYRNVAAAVQSFITTKGWNIVPDSTYTSTVTASSSVNNRYTVTTTTGLVVGMPISFSGSTFGGVSPATVYYIFSIPSATEFTISPTSPIQNPLTAAVLVLGTATGTMTITSSLAGLSSNSTNARQRVYYAYNLSGPIYKYIRLNLIDLTIDTAMVFTVSTNGGQTFYSGTNQAYRFNHYQHTAYPRDYYINNTTSPTSSGTSVSLGGASHTVNTNTGLSGGLPFNGSNALSFTTNAGWPFYPGQVLMAYSVGSGNYSWFTVSSWTENTGTLVASNVSFATTAGSNRSDWALLYPGTLNYNNSLNPAYVYISCTARHICIQTRHTDGTWNDWISVTEFENPLGLSNGSLSTTATASWGLTTGYMSGNSGYTINANSGTSQTGLQPPAAAGAISTLGVGNYGTSLTNNAGSVSNVQWGQKTNPSTSMAYYGKWVIFTGPMSVPYTYKSRSSSFAAQTTKLITPLGEAGVIGALYRQNFSAHYRQTTDIFHVIIDEIGQLFFKGMGDVMSNAPNTAAGTKHFALTPSINIDYGNEGTISNFIQNNLLDTWQGHSTSALTSNTSYGFFASYRNQSQYSTTQPTPMGRIYQIKYVTTTLSTLNTISIKVDSSGFVSSSGSTTDHLTFCYPSYYQSPDVNTNLGNTQNKALAANGAETGLTAANIQISQSVAVAFPK